MIYSTGCSVLDEILGGGVQSGMLTQIYGEPGSGKTNLCMMLAISCVRSGRRVVYIDTEGISMERFKQILGDSEKQVLSKFFFYRPTSFQEQREAIEGLKNLLKLGTREGERIGMVILDSATIFYRFELTRDQERNQEIIRELCRQMLEMLGLAREYDLAVVITNQVYLDIDVEELKPLGGLGLGHLSKLILQLEKLDKPGLRRAILRKHPHMPEGISCEFRLVQTGLEPA